ncbi:50S ribosomal protein L24 [Chryseotalea sanaruensis]|jgi:large subunit ribosomal protein L24|uniref:Large ribosomal subunit protein uL24 n=1 Tax=Chryseotalea sanaruensis TaxID=2482724 RepID=A0A401UFB1_9BACT|nr:50S ribosomal protein L24 [Chryseotalea sanaruensis]GCC53562.1 50S ribosomal protein L24 [Chryseotalea sanaruensis]
MERKFNKQPKLNIRKGDTVQVIAGDDKGKSGKVLEIQAVKNRAVVEGIAIVTKHTKPSAGKPEGGIKKTEGTINISNLMLVDPASGKPTRVGRKKDAEGNLQRFAKKTGEIIK